VQEGSVLVMLKKLFCHTRRLLLVATALGIVCVFWAPVGAARRPMVSLGSYNVENLFDLKNDTTEYPGYVPGGRLGWDRKMLAIKLDHLARVVSDMEVDILALQEIESARALDLLNRRLKSPYAYQAIADNKATTVKCALLSRYRIAESGEVEVPGKGSRNILKARVMIDGYPLIVFVNHWKAKTAPESRRLPYARALAEEIAGLDADADFVVVGDLNSNYNEFETLAENPGLNDTGGETGINHILNTLHKDRLVTERRLRSGSDGGLYLYNLWLELKPKRRWSVRYYNSKSSHDHILVSPGLYDDQGLSYVDNSFDKFDPGYLFCKSGVCRWQRAKKGRGRHLGHGFSDHLPVFAWLAPRPHSFRQGPPYPLETLSVAKLYQSRTGRVNYRLQDCAVIYRQGKYTIIKQRGGRAILVYGSNHQLKPGKQYHLVVKRLQRYHGMLEILETGDVRLIGQSVDKTSYFIESSGRSLADPHLVNEVVRRIHGVYRGGWFYYGNGRKIRLFAKDKELLPQPGSTVILYRVRIGYYNHPQLVLENSGQIAPVK